MPTVTGLRAARRTRVRANPSRTASVPAIAERDGKRHLVRIAGWIEEHQRSEHEQDCAGECGGTVRRKERIGDEEARGEDHQQHARERDGEHLQAVEPENQ